MRAIGVFCGARGGSDPAFLQTASDLGATLAGAGIRVVFGGGHVGMMGVLADGALAAGGEVIGVIPRDLLETESGHQGVTKLHVVDGMHERKALMGALSDAFLALPGGLGTLEELFEVLTWAQLGFQRKPCCLLNVGGFFDHLIAHVDRTVETGFLSTEDRSLVQVAASPGDALRSLGI